MAQPGQILPVLPVQLAGPDLRAVAGAFVELARLDLLRNKLPPLYSAGVRYTRESSGAERWQLPSETARRGLGDCEDLAVWRVAELRAQGEPAKLLLSKSGPRLWHALVRRGNGTTEDPSARLGMKGRA